VLAVVVAYTIIGPAWGEDHDKPMNRLIRAAVTVRQTLVFGGPHDLEAPVAALQPFVPRGARIGFWGVSAGMLDYRRNPVIDLTGGAKRTDAMAPMDEGDLRHVDYVLLENIEPKGVSDAWNARSTPTAAVDSKLELRATSDGAFLFRVRR
jgi:hypothetical protein